MPTLITHPIVPLTLRLALGREIVSNRLLAFGVIGSVLPDLDVVAFRLGVPYAAEFGHRGFSHSLLFAFAAALLGASLFGWLHTRFVHAFLFLFATVASHGLLDTLTNGGLGIALLWPWSQERYFAPFQPIEVSPLGVRRFFTARGLSVVKSELLWVWAPALAMCAVALGARLATKTRPAAPR